MLGTKSYRRYNNLIRDNKVLVTIAVLAIFAMLLPVEFTATVKPTSDPGSMATLQNVPAIYAVSIVPGAAQRESQLVNHAP